MKDKAVSGLGSCLSKPGRYEVWGSLRNGVVVQSQGRGGARGRREKRRGTGPGVDIPAEESGLCKHMCFICVMYTYFMCYVCVRYLLFESISGSCW